MSLMGINRAFQKHGVVWGSIMAGLMIIGVVFSGLGANLFRGGRGGGAPVEQTSPTEQVVAKVGDIPVTRAMLDTQVQSAIQRQAMFGGPAQQPKPEDMDIARVQLGLQPFKSAEAVIAAAKAAGITIAPADIAQERDKDWQQQRAELAQKLGLASNATDSQIDSALANQGSNATTAAFKAQIPDFAVEAQLAQEDLQKALRNQIQVSPDLVKRSYDDIQVRHILIKTGPGGLPDDQAKAKAEKVLAAVMKDPSKMAELANANSDDPGNVDPKTKQKRGGFYDWAPASQYVPEFSQAALQAGAGKVYPEVVKTQFGYHIIKLEGERPGKDLPKDFEKNEQTYIDQYKDRIVQTKLQDAIQAQIPNVSVDVTDPGLRAAQLQIDAMQIPDKKLQAPKLEQALAELDKVSKSSDILGVVPLEKARILVQLGRDNDAIAAYKDALTYQSAPETRMALAQLYLKQKDVANAKIQLAKAQEAPIPDAMEEMNLSQLLKQAGDSVGAKKASDRAIEILKRQQEMQKEQQAAMLPPAPSAPAKGSAAGTTTAPDKTAPATAASPAPAKAGG